MGETTTIVIDPERCDPTSWTAHDLIAFAKFVQVGGSVAAARLAKMGLRVVATEHHEPLGGTLEMLGYATPIKPGEDLALEEGPREICDNADKDPIGPTPVVKIYQGPVQYAVGLPIGDDDGCIEGYEFEFKDTLEEAEAVSRSIREAA